MKSECQKCSSHYSIKVDMVKRSKRQRRGANRFQLSPVSSTHMGSFFPTASLLVMRDPRPDTSHRANSLLWTSAAGPRGPFPATMAACLPQILGKLWLSPMPGLQENQVAAFLDPPTPSLKLYFQVFFQKGLICTVNLYSITLTVVLLP